MGVFVCNRFKKRKFVFKINYKNGKRHGPFISYYPDGARAVITHYIENITEGDEIGYYRSGHINYRGAYKSGVEDGTWTWYNEDGTVKSTEQRKFLPPATISRNKNILALAQKNPQPYLDDLAEIIKNKSSPQDLDAYHGWRLLFKYIQEQSREVVKSGAMDKYLDALEDAPQISSGEPRDLYAFYIYCELSERSKAFREKCKTIIPYDMGVFFNQVDKYGSNYYINESIRENYN